MWLLLLCIIEWVQQKSCEPSNLNQRASYLMKASLNQTWWNKKEKESVSLGIKYNVHTHVLRVTWIDSVRQFVQVPNFYENFKFLYYSQ